jgi:hypothetical protein
VTATYDGRDLYFEEPAMTQPLLRTFPALALLAALSLPLPAFAGPVDSAASSASATAVRVEGAVKRGVNAGASAVQRGGRAAASAVDKGASAVSRVIEKGANKVGLKGSAASTPN